MLNFTTYKHHDSTEWVTFIHGAGGSSTIWFKQLREFKRHFNVLLIDLRGHGRSKTKHLDIKSMPKYTFEVVTKDVMEVLDHLKIEKSHFIGISLGTIIIRQLAEMQPNRISSMIMGGAILKMNLRSQILIKLGVAFKSILPYLWLYSLFAFVIMPKKNHKSSRNLFITEAKKLYQKEFIRWFKLTSELNPLLKFFRLKDINIPTLYIMGEEDYLFLPSVQNVVKAHKASFLHIIEKCGHVVNVDEPDIFNTESINFIQGLKSC
ncbi:MAG: alpha/beta fold hydrolase [Flavobacteriales bacterium]